MLRVIHSGDGYETCYDINMRKIYFLKGARKSLALLLAALCTLPTGAFAQPSNELPSLGDAASDALSPLMERKIGDNILRQMRRAHDMVEDAELEQYLNTLGNRLVANAPKVESDFYFFAVKDNTLNAFAMPGGIVGVHTGLLLAAQSESELASVLGHEIGHVVQRHLARMLTKQGQSSIVAIASLVLAILAAKSSPEAAQGLVMAGAGFQAQSQLSFSRDAEHEADRIGLQILQRSGFNPQDMVTFFGRLQQAGRLYENNAPAYLRTHPLTTDRIADIQNRVGNVRPQQKADSMEFVLLRAKLRALQDESIQGLRDTRKRLETQLAQQSSPNEGATWYALAMTQYLQRDWNGAENALQRARHKLLVPHPYLERLEIDLKIASGQPAVALVAAQTALKKFPASRALAHAYAQALQENQQHLRAIEFLRDQATLYRQEPVLQQMLAKSYNATGQRALANAATAEYYVQLGAYPAALEQLQMARRAADADFYQLSVIDARTHEVQTLVAEEAKERLGR